MDIVLTICLALPFLALIAIIGWMMFKGNPSFLFPIFRGISKEERALEYKERVAAILGGGPILVVLFSIVLTLFLVGDSIWFIGLIFLAFGILESIFVYMIMTRNDRKLIRNTDDTKTTENKRSDE
jgi:hypothetical protein